MITGHRKSTQGFTLIEIIVSLGLFSVVAVIPVGAFLKVIDANKQSQALKTAVDNTDFLLESMTREMRVGSNYTCLTSSGNLQVGPNLSNSPETGQSCTAIAFYSSVPDPNENPTTHPCAHTLIHAYRLDSSNSIDKAEQASCTDTIGDNTATPFIPVVSSDLKIQGFNINLTSGTPNVQPKAFILLHGYAGTAVADSIYFTVQSTVSERLMNGNGE